MTEPMPRLTETLPPATDWNHCQNCGGVGVDYWTECDDADVREYRLIALCQRCSDRIIEPHPRLYYQVANHEPMPGVMAVCRDCRHRSVLRCTNPRSQVNGGPGIKVVYPRPAEAVACSRGKGGGCRRVTIWMAPPTCEDKEANRS